MAEELQSISGGNDFFEGMFALNNEQNRNIGFDIIIIARVADRHLLTVPALALPLCIGFSANKEERYKLPYLMRCDFQPFLGE